MTPAERLEHLRTKGMQTLTDLDDDKISVMPSWFDKEKFARAKDVLDKYYIGVQFSSFTGLLLVLQLPEGLEPLLSTGNSKHIPALYKRYVSTVMHIRSWYEDDIFDPSTKGYKSIRVVRSMHRRVTKIMNEKFNVLTEDGQPRVWVTQYDMALTQFAFIGLAMIWPHKCGLISARIDELESINYYWRVLGFCMGIRDEFNACAYDSYDQIQEYMRIMFDKEYKETYMKSQCPIGLEMTKGIMTSFEYYMPLLTFNVLAEWWAPEFTFNGHKLVPLSFKEKILLAWLKFSFDHVLRATVIVRPFSRIHRRQFDRRLKRKDIVYNELVKKYSDEPKFVSDRIDYFVSKTKRQPETEESTKNIISGCPFHVQTAYTSHFDGTFDQATTVTSPENTNEETKNDQVEQKQDPVANVETPVIIKKREVHLEVINNNTEIAIQS